MINTDFSEVQKADMLFVTGNEATLGWFLKISIAERFWNNKSVDKFPFLNLNPKVGLVAICKTSYAKKEEEERQKEIIFDDSTRILSP